LEALATFCDQASLIDALRQVREMRNISFATLDEIAGLPAGYSSKVLSPHGERRPTLQSLGWLLGGLGVKCLVVDDPAGLKQINGRMVARDHKVVRGGPHFTIRRYLSEIGKRGARARNARRRAELNGGGRR
jgi:hypothetical protein